jgi:hypothetical protein
MNAHDKKKVRFTFICDAAERQMITAIAKQLHRSQGDAIRFLVRTAVQELHFFQEPQGDSHRKEASDVEIN